jgi:hypothetical protein
MTVSTRFPYRAALCACALPLAITLAVTLTISTSGCVLQGAPPLDTSILIPGNGVTIYAAGDIAECKKTKPADTAAAQTAALIDAALGADRDAAVLGLGDNVYPAGSSLDFRDCYAPTWGRFKTRTHPAPGNHEYYTAGAAGYFDYFGAAAGPEQRGYYSFDLGQWHVLSLNSNLKAEQHQAQLAWLKADLAQHKTRCALAYWHHPLYSSGGHGNNEHMRDVWQVLQGADVEVVLVGHDHDYERFAPQDDQGRRDDMHGIREIVVGTGGAELESFLLPRFNREAANDATHGVLKMVLKPSGYEWEFLPVGGGRFTDRGAAFCH